MVSIKFTISEIIFVWGISNNIFKIPACLCRNIMQNVTGIKEDMREDIANICTVAYRETQMREANIKKNNLLL